jgi:hypothetical protein
MRPRLARYREMRARCADAIQRAQRFVGDAASGIASAHLAHEFCGKACRPIALATRYAVRVSLGVMALPCKRTTLANHVGHIVSLGAEEEICGIHASRIISGGAVVTDLQAIGDRPMRQRPCNAVGAQLSPSSVESAIPGRGVAIPRPKPASARSIHQRPESLRDAFGGIGLPQAGRARPGTTPLFRPNRSEGSGALGTDAAILGLHSEPPTLSATLPAVSAARGLSLCSIIA